MKTNFALISCLATILSIAWQAVAFSQCTEFYSMNSWGGQDAAGSFFKTDDNGNNLQTVYSLRNRYEQDDLCDRFCEADNGRFYGVAGKGGSNGTGILFEWDPETNAYATKINFNGVENGKMPTGSLIKTSNGNLYGITYQGGTHDLGVLFEWNPLTNAIAKKLDFDGENMGSHPVCALIRAKSGKFYGMTDQGGANNMGVLFEWDQETNAFKKKFDFDNIRGRSPHGSLVQADNGKLYGMTRYGGAFDLGIIFTWDPETDSLTKILDFNGANGKRPFGSLIQASNGKLYGMATFGGNENSEGVLFELDPETGNYNKKMEFSRPVTGYCPYGSLIQANNGKLYGTVCGGPANYNGAIFEWDIESETYSVKVSFEGYDDALGTLIQAGNGKLYGINDNVGFYKGGIYEWDPVTGIFQRKFDFFRVVDSVHPVGSFVQAGNGKLYGMSFYGDGTTPSELGSGAIFEWDPVLSKYSNKVNFNGENGSHPTGSLIQAGNGRLYGMTSEGGDYGFGVLFELDPESGNYAKKLDFNGSENGKTPYGSLMQAGNGKLYGMTSQGGANGMGVVFEWDPVNDLYSKKIDFNGKANGRYPHGSLIMASNSKIYGMTADGGIFGYDGSSHAGNITGYGVLFEWDPETNEFNKKYDFSIEKGDHPMGSLVEAENGKLYGVTKAGGANNSGTLFEFDPLSGLYTTKLDFKDAETGYSPNGSLLCARNGKLYGLTSQGGNEWGAGLLFEYDPATEIYTIKYRGVTAADPFEKNLIEIPKTPGYTSIHTCHSYVSPSGKYIWTSSGTYTDTIPGTSGCDSIIAVQLTINHGTASTITAITCDSYRSPSGNYAWNESGTYIDTIPNAAGCDSIITVNLSAVHLNTAVVNSGSGLQAVYGGAQYQWVNCSSEYSTIAGDTGQSFTPHISGTYAVIITDQGCADTSVCYTIATTGLPENETGKGMTIYPNPTSGRFAIDLGKVYSTGIITITRYDGQVIRKENILNKQKIDLDLEAPPGIYMVTITTERNEAVFKIVKE
jgi:uncharacterized repeat protein (TIGR03803 family)